VTERLAATTLRNSMLVVGARALAKLAVFVVVVLLPTSTAVSPP